MSQASKRRATVRAATVAVTALLAGQLSGQPVQASAAAVTFYVVGADGLPVVRPYVMSWVTGGERLVVHQSRGTDLGRVTVAVPDDPVAAVRKESGLPVNLLTLVTDRRPGTPGIQAMAFNSSINATGIPGLPVDVGRTGGPTYTLVPGLVEFWSEGDPTAPVVHDEEGCPNGIFGSCYIKDIPPWARENFVSVADNWGAGRDIVANLEYQSTLATTTTSAVQFGQSGFFEAKAYTSFENKTTLGLPLGDIGPQNNHEVFLQSRFQRTRAGVCWMDGDLEKQCTIDTSYLPYDVIGSHSAPLVGWHDTLDIALDCKNYFRGEWNKGSGTEASVGFSFKLGPSESWTTSMPFEETGFLHATTETTNETTSSESLIRRWRTVAKPAYEMHFVMVKGGLVDYDPTAAARTCPEGNVDDIYTHSSNDCALNPACLGTDTAEDVHERVCDGRIAGHLGTGEATVDPTPTAPPGPSSATYNAPTVTDGRSDTDTNEDDGECA